MTNSTVVALDRVVAQTESSQVLLILLIIHQLLSFVGVFHLVSQFSDVILHLLLLFHQIVQINPLVIHKLLVKIIVFKFLQIIIK